MAKYEDGQPCTYPGCDAAFSKSLSEREPDGGGSYTGWYWPDWPEMSDEEVPEHDHAVAEVNA
jgi:hypothetical protein